MFSFLKSDPTKKLRKERDSILEKAMLAQRSGDIRGYSELTAKAEALYEEIQTVEKANG